jgi:hypothetical protein
MNQDPDRLYELLPVIYRMRDAEEGYPLKALLRVVAEQVNVVEEDIRRLYENWFIETAEDWVVPYIGDLVGYRQVHEAGQPRQPNTAQGAANNRVLIPRREVANIVRHRRRKGALAQLELLAQDVAGWPARASEFYRLLGWTQNINHPRPERGRTVDVRDIDALDLLDGAFDRLAHTADVRRVNSARPRGRHNIPSAGVFVWRLKTYSVTRMPAACLESTGPQNYTFSVLGHNTQLFTNPAPEAEPTDIAGELNLPAPIRRRAFEQRREDYYGEGRSFVIWAGSWANYDADYPLPASAIIPTDLTDWHYLPPRNHVAVDPVLGRITFPEDQLPKKVRVSYRYGFSADMGGGEYDRRLSQPSGAVFYRVGANESFKSIHDALVRWRQDEPEDAVIELMDSGVYVERIHVHMRERQSLQIRAANRARPVIRLLDWNVDLPDALGVTMAKGSRLTLDGLLITGRAVHVTGGARPRKSAAKKESDKASYKESDIENDEESDIENYKEGSKESEATHDKDDGAICAAEVSIRHCTLVPGWGVLNNCDPKRPAEPSLEMFNVRARLRIEHSIVGSIQINEDEVRADPVPVYISDSIIDSTGSQREAIGAPGQPAAHAVLTIQRTTVFGYVQVHAIQLAENTIFTDCLNVARRQLGCVRFCYVPHGCRTPRRYQCQPDLAAQSAVAARLQETPTLDAAEAEAERRRQRERVRPQFNSMRYGNAGYAQLSETCAVEIKRGADDESEMGAFHDLFQPQREANLRARLSEYSPAGMETGIILVT